MLKQISVFVENKQGKLREVTGILRENKINILALSVADTADFGILRLIVSDEELTLKVLKEKNIAVKLTDVIAVKLGHTPGSLDQILNVLDQNQISVEYMYTFLGDASLEAAVILKVSDAENALGVLSENQIGVITADEVEKLK